jgi:energy-converting hydrogenase A subunit P
MTFFTYIREFLRFSWIKTFFTVKTPPLVSPSYFRDFPKLTGKDCTHCFTCRMICPSPGAIDVIQTAGVWNPVVYAGHCVRCGYCVEACPEGVLTSGDLLTRKEEQGLFFSHEYIVKIDTEKCMGCGNCATACPANRELDPQIGAGGTSFSEEVVIRVENGKNTVKHNERCTGCKTCMETCPNGAIHVIRNVVALQESK